MKIGFSKAIDSIIIRIEYSMALSSIDLWKLDPIVLLTLLILRNEFFWDFASIIIFYLGYWYTIYRYSLYSPDLPLFKSF